MARLIELAEPLPGSHVFTSEEEYVSFDAHPDCTGIFIPYYSEGSVVFQLLSAEGKQFGLDILNEMKFPLFSKSKTVAFRPVVPGTSDAFVYPKVAEWNEQHLEQTAFISSKKLVGAGAAKNVFKGYLDAFGYTTESEPLASSSGTTVWRSLTSWFTGDPEEEAVRARETDSQRRFVPIVFGFFNVTQESLDGGEHPGVQSFYRDAIVSTLTSNMLVLERRTPHVPAFLFSMDCTGLGFANFPAITPHPQKLRQQLVVNTHAGFPIDGQKEHAFGYSQRIVLAHVKSILDIRTVGKAFMTRMIFQALWTLAAMDEIGMVHNDIWMRNVLLARQNVTAEGMNLEGVTPRDYAYRIADVESDTQMTFRPDAAVDALVARTGVEEHGVLKYLFLSLIDFDRGHITADGGVRRSPPVGLQYDDGSHIFNFYVHPPEVVLAKKNPAGHELLKYTQPFTALTDMFTMGLVLIGLVLGVSYYDYVSEKKQSISDFARYAFPSHFDARRKMPMSAIIRDLHNEYVENHGGSAEWGTPKNLYEIIMMMTMFGFYDAAEEMKWWSVIDQVSKALEESSQQLGRDRDRGRDFSYWMNNGGFLWKSSSSPLVLFFGRGSRALDILREMTTLNPAARKRALAILVPNVDGTAQINKAFLPFVADPPAGAMTWNLQFSKELY